VSYAKITWDIMWILLDRHLERGEIIVRLVPV
jgi:hypothetical protein